MSGKTSTKRRHAVAKRCARLRGQHLTLVEIAGTACNQASSAKPVERLAPESMR